MTGWPFAGRLALKRKRASWSGHLARGTSLWLKVRMKKGDCWCKGGEGRGGREEGESRDMGIDGGVVVH